jgi:hypothetical protein
MKALSLNILYRSYKHKFFLALLEDPKFYLKTSRKIRELIKKPWNPYIDI